MSQERAASIKASLRSHHCGEISEKNIGDQVTLCGWVNKARDLGGLYFLDLRDKYGLIQLSFTELLNQEEKIKTLLKQCVLESVIRITGEVRKRPLEAQNPEMKSGMIEVRVDKLELLSQSDVNRLPFIPQGKIEATEDQRLRYRYIDLRTQKLQDILKLRSLTTQKIRNRLHEMDFVEVETPILYKSTPEGARDYIVPSRVHPKHVYALPQSPQTLKQLLMIGGTDKYFQICRCFRDEDLRADRQPEFSQIDIEASFVTADSIKSIAEELVKTSFNLPGSFEVPVMSYDEALERFGSDKPDIRFALEHHIVTELFQGTEFKVFLEVIGHKGMIKAIFLPSSIGQLSRKNIDELTEVVRPYGGQGVAFFKQEGSEVSGGISKFITPEILKELSDKLSDEEDEQSGTWLFIADKKIDTVHAAADALRRHLGHLFKLHAPGHHFLWVYDFPLFEYDDEQERFVARHHPFTMPKVSQLPSFLEKEFSKDNKKEQEFFLHLKAEAYDLVCNGYELGGGSIRIYQKDVQEKMFKLLGLGPDEVKKQFGFFVEALSFGTPPHGGIALGLDRLIMLLAQTDNIRDVMAFPKTSSAADLMSQAPSTPSAEQIKELHFNWSDAKPLS